MIQLIVGLGNPGAQYEHTRHNAGAWWVDQIARSWGASLQMDRGYNALLARVNRDGQPRWLLEPQTFMNLSGQSVAALARFFKIEPSRILVAHDELDLVPGDVRIKLGGGHAGHNGLRDIHAQLGSSDYWRLRIGIGHPGDKSAVSGWVLGKPQAEHRDVIQSALDRAMTALPELLGGDFTAAMRRIHTKPTPPAAPKPQAPKPAAPSAA